MSDYIAESTPGEIDETYDRMVQILDLITGTQAPELITEYSALLCAAAMLITLSRGIDPSQENCARVLHLVAGKFIPELEAMDFD